MENREFVLCNPSDIQNMSTLKSNDMWVAVVKQKQNLLSEIDDSKYCLVLDTINDPGNMGTILRIADWYWIDQVVCNSVTVELYNPKVIMSSMGSFTRVKVISCDLGEYLTNTKLPIYWAFLEWENVHTASFAPVANIVIWNESHGISQEIEKFITDKITIPRFWKAESLNAWVATWVILDNILRNISN
jgi:TrmH family RNA methyltransferase